MLQHGFALMTIGQFLLSLVIVGLLLLAALFVASRGDGHADSIDYMWWE